MYRILPYTLNRAKQLGVVVIPSDRKGKKIDVYSPTGRYICSVGAIGFNDYPTYLKKYGKKIADERRRLYKIRHDSDRHVRGSAGWYADKLLW